MRTFRPTIPLGARRYSVRVADVVDAGRLRGEVRTRPGKTGVVLHPPHGEEEGDDLPLSDLYPEWPTEPADDDVVGLGVGEYVLMGGGAAPLMLIARTR